MYHSTPIFYYKYFFFFFNKVDLDHPDITFKLKQVANWWLINLLADETKIKLNSDTCRALVCCTVRCVPGAFYRVHTLEGVWGQG